MVSSDSNSEPPLPRIRPGAQSKACQKAHWKRIHKTECPLYVAVHQDSKIYRKDRLISRDTARWIHAWSPAIFFCSPIALDLPNHEWGRHETHRYVPYAVQVCLF